MMRSKCQRSLSESVQLCNVLSPPTPQKQKFPPSDLSIACLIVQSRSTIQLDNILLAEYHAVCQFKNGDCAQGVYTRRVESCCTFFCEQNDFLHRTFIWKCFLLIMKSVCPIKQCCTPGSINSLKDTHKLLMKADMSS